MTASFYWLDDGGSSYVTQRLDIESHEMVRKSDLPSSSSVCAVFALDLWGIASQHFTEWKGAERGMPGFSLFNKMAIGAGFCASVIGIGQWLVNLTGSGQEPIVVIQQDNATPAPIVTHPPGSDEARIADMISRSITCDGLSLDVLDLARQDTAAADSTSGQPGFYLEASIFTKLDDETHNFPAIGSGRGPGGEGQAFNDLLASVQQQVSQKYSECK